MSEHTDPIAWWVERNLPDVELTDELRDVLRRMYALPHTVALSRGRRAHTQLGSDFVFTVTIGGGAAASDRIRRLHVAYHRRQRARARRR